MNQNNRSKTPARSTQKGALATSKSKRKRNRNGKRKTTARRGIHLSPCAMDYAKAKLDPFDYSNNYLPCIPDLLDIPSQKFMTLQRGTFVTGTSGIGFIQYDPTNFSNDVYNVLYSSVNFSGAAFPAFGGVPPAGQSSSYNSRFPWSFIRSPAVRVVSSALRIRYTGTELNKGGSIATISENSANAGLLGLTMTDVSDRTDSQRALVSRAWTSVSWQPAYPAAFEYFKSSSSVPVARVAMLVISTPNNSFDFEICNYYEAISTGDEPVSSSTKSHSDAFGFGVVKDFISNETVQQVGGSVLQSFLRFAQGPGAAAAASYIGGPATANYLLEYL